MYLQLIQKCSYDISHWIQGGFAVYTSNSKAVIENLNGAQLFKKK
jgi:hypothetical protein